MKTLLNSIGILTVLLAGHSVRANGTVMTENLRQGLVLHLPCDHDETGAGKVTDSSGQNNHAKASGVSWRADGTGGGAYEFTADGDQIVVPNNASLNPEQLTLATWIKTSHKSDKWLRIFDKSWCHGYAMSIVPHARRFQRQGLVCVEIGPGTHYSKSRTKIDDGQWHHVALTFNGTEQLFFVDGRPQGRGLRWASPGHPGTTDHNLTIGCNLSGPEEDQIGFSMRGLIDDPMMWNRTLSMEEIAFLHDSRPKAKQSNQNLTRNPADSPAVPKQLQGIMHFTDNDVRFRSASGANVFVDPVSWPNDGIVDKTGMAKPDLILITHSHLDHFLPRVLRAYHQLNPQTLFAGPSDVVSQLKDEGIQATEIKPSQHYTLGGISFTTVPAYNLESDIHPKSKGWVGYILEINGTHYYVTGDTDPIPEMANLKVDVLFPLLYGCGGNLEQAVKMVELSQPQLVVPVHTNDREGTIKRFLRQLPQDIQGVYYLRGEFLD
ncbi:LamG-like jellyroll fold domain-containing protein [Planctomycetota bacterium]